MRTRFHYRLLAVAALLLFFALALNTAGQEAITTDEPLHLARGIAMRQIGYLSLSDKHVPLIYRLVSLALLTEDDLPQMSRFAAWGAGSPYAIGQELVTTTGWPIDRAIWLSRAVIVLLGVVLGALLAAWTRALTHHLPATAVVLALYALSPNLLAAASLLTTDMATTATTFAAVFTWWRYWRRPGRGRWLLAAVCLGLALGTKLTGALLLPLTFVQAYAAAWPGRWGGVAGWRRWARPGLVWLAMLPLAGLALWALYGFETRGLPMPGYWQAWMLLFTELSAGHANFFMGEVTSTDSILYLAVTLLLKTPLLQLLLLLLAPVALWRDRWRYDGRSVLAFIVLPAALLLAVVAASRLNYGYRYALPAVPFLMLLRGTAAAWLWDLPAAQGRRVARAALVLGLGGTAVVALRLHPDYLTYFNALARGQGYRLLGDSNLDWGQDVNQLGEYARAYEAATGQPLRYSYSGAANPAHYGLTGPSLIAQFEAGETEFAPANPPAGRYGINVGDWQGTGLRLGLLSEIDLFDWFRHREPLTTLGGSIFIYDVAAPAEGDWVAHCAAPGRLLDDAATERLVDRAGLRHVTFDCTTNWVFPAGPGWYVLPPGEMWIDDWLGAGLNVVYRHRANAYGPDYVVVYWSGADCAWPSPTGQEGVEPAGSLSLWERVRERGFWPGEIRPSPQPSPQGRGGAEPSPQPSPEGRGSCSPALLPYSDATSAPAILTAYGARGAEWLTLWEVREATAAPLSLQAHLNQPGGAIEVADGLGFTADQWQPGDRFAQRHLFATPGDTLDTGFYNYATLERLGPPITLTTK